MKEELQEGAATQQQPKEIVLNSAKSRQMKKHVEDISVLKHPTPFDVFDHEISETETKRTVWTKHKRKS